ncbi:hypothetical protein BRC2024_YMPIZCAT_CDS_0041 [Acinetobacter phage vB_AbaP_Margaret]
MTNYVVKNAELTTEQHDRLQGKGYKFDNTNGEDLTGGNHFIVSDRINEYSTNANNLCLLTCGGFELYESVDQIIDVLPNVVGLVVGARVKLNNLQGNPKMFNYKTWGQAGFELGDAGTIIAEVDYAGDVYVRFDTASHPDRDDKELWVAVADLILE